MAGEAQSFVTRRKQRQIDGRIKQADAAVRDRGNDVDPFRQSRGLDLRSSGSFIGTDAKQNQCRLRYPPEQIEAETLVLLIAQPADLAEDETFGRQAERCARLGTRKHLRNVVAVDDHRHVVPAIGLDDAIRAADHLRIEAEPMDDVVERHREGVTNARGP